MTNHFDTIADIYNRVWYFSEHYQSSMLENITTLLKLEPSDSLADIGGGTGVYTKLLCESVGLHKAYCIEPSRNMYLEACKLEGIESIHADADEFMGLDLDFTKVLLKEAVHHIPRRDRLWHYLSDALPKSGRVLIVTRPQDISLPLFESAKQGFRRKQPHYDTLVGELTASGFAAEVKLHPYRFVLAKETWFQMIRNRFMSDLAGFSEAEIEAGIQEIDARYPVSQLEIPDTIVYIAASIPA